MAVRSRALVWIVVLLLVLLAGSFMWETQQRAGWVATTGQVLEHTYSLHVRYRVEGNAYALKTRIGLLDLFNPTFVTTQGAAVPVLYDPRTPADAALDTFNARYGLTLTLAVLLGVMLAAILFRLRRDESKQQIKQQRAQSYKRDDRGSSPTVRLLINLMLAVGLIFFGVHLLLSDFFKLRGFVFSGASLYLLAIAAFSLAALALAVLRAWLQGTLAAPPALGSTLTDLAHYRAAIIERFWPFVAAALSAFILALFLS